MHVVLWRFRCKPGAEAAFEAAYGPRGDWARLFRGAPEFLGTELLRGSDGTYLTIDRWTSAEAVASFRKRHAKAYASLDARCEALTESESAVAAVDL
jgi:heme-degrading monooxygenase HmoA